MTTDVAVIEAGDDTGLGDMDESDMSTPRIKIDHDEAVYVDSLSGERFESFNGIILALVKGRVLWDADVANDAAPLCKSYDHKVGHADAKNFPWIASTFDAGKFDAEDPILPCDACPLKDWGTHPKGNNPWCTEQHTLAVLREVAPGSWSPALITFQRSSIKVSRTYLSSYKAAGTGAYTHITKFGLTAEKRGKNKYAVPVLQKGAPTDIVDHGAYATQGRAIRAFVMTPRARTEEDGAAPAAPAAPVDDFEVQF